MRFKGYCDTLVFNVCLEQVLVPALRPGQTVLMDNASFHKSTTTKTLIESKGCTLKYLPTNSPDLNPIEPQWAILKARLRKHKAVLFVGGPGLPTAIPRGIAANSLVTTRFFRA